MKKKTIAIVALIALLLSILGTATASPGSADDPFITLSYLINTFFPETKEELLEQAQHGTAELEQTALDRLETLSDSYLEQPDGSKHSDTFAPITLARGDRLGIPAGTSFLFTGGLCQLDIFSGSLIDVTTGSVLSSDGELLSRHRYVAADNTACTITAISDSVYLSVRGIYKLDSSGVTYSPFIDLCSSDWHYSYAIYAYENGLFSGTSATQFSPGTNMNRAMLATVLSRLNGIPNYIPSVGFTDVEEGTWYADAVNWAALVGIVNGRGDGTFAPNDSVTREQLCTMLYRYARNYLGLDVSASADLSGFTDHTKVSSYAQDAVAWAVATGLVTGTSTTTLSPGGTATRAQVAAILQRFNNLY